MTKYEGVSTRSGFNAVVRHVKATISYVEAVAGRTNLGDVFFASTDADGLNADRIASILRMVLVDRFGYRAVSRNLRSVCDNLEEAVSEIRTWDAVDIVLAYHHPDLGLLTANPKNSEQIAAFGALKTREPLVAYVGRFDKPADDLCSTAADIAIAIFEGVKVTIPGDLYKGSCAYRPPKKKTEAAVAPIAKVPARRGPKPKNVAPAPVPKAQVRVSASAASPQPSAPRQGMRMTPMYSVTVQNELFHNGNVEAWKRIIESYKTSHPNLEVYIYYDNERILNINSLFKWGKVKHGSTIQFAVAGNDIKDVAKLQRYLIQGASHQFEAFLHGPVSTVLKLF